MSGILKKLKNKKKFACAVVLAALEAVLIVFRLYILGILLPCVLLLNWLVKNKLEKQRRPFYPHSLIRNVDYLIIGDMCDASEIVPEGSTYVQIAAPGRGLAASYEILRHTFSILKENGGNAVIVVKRRNSEKEKYSLFDVGFFHTVTINKLGLEDKIMMSKLPFVFSPIKSLVFLLGIRKVKNIKDYHNEEIERFCAEREIGIRILEG